MNRTGISRVEVVAALLVVVLIVALVMPAVLSAREAARFAACQNNLRQLGVALQGFQQTHGVFPPGTKIEWRFQSVFYVLLPHLGMQSLYDKFDHTWEGTEPEFHKLQNTPFPLLRCPSDWGNTLTTKRAAKTNYAGNIGTGINRYGYNGMFRPLSSFGPTATYRTGPIGPDDVHDGLSNTAALSEWLCGGPETHGRDRLRTVWRLPRPLGEPAQLEEFAALCRTIPENASRYGWQGNGWLGGSWLFPSFPDSQYSHVLAPGNPSCYKAALTANSLHLGGVNVLFADGHVQCIARNIDQQAWRAIGSRVECDLIFRLDW